jgi:hypothetical protein
VADSPPLDIIALTLSVNLLRIGMCAIDMKNFKSFTICAVVVLAMIASGQTPRIVKPSADEMLERRLPGNEVEYFTTRDAFSMGLSGVGMAGGGARVLGCEGDYFKQLWGPMNKTLRQALDTIVETDPRYRWELVDGVINLLPAKAEPALLQTHISEFRVENMFSAMDALSPLLALPEVKKAMDDLHLKPGIAVFVSSVSRKPFSVKCKNVTLRQALNAIALAQGHITWDYVELHCGGKDEVIVRF